MQTEKQLRSQLGFQKEIASLHAECQRAYATLADRAMQSAAEFTSYAQETEARLMAIAKPAQEESDVCGKAQRPSAG